jgi:hypothetical protein
MANRYAQLIAQVPRGSFYDAAGDVLPWRSTPYQFLFTPVPANHTFLIFVNDQQVGQTSSDISGTAIVTVQLDQGRQDIALVDIFDQSRFVAPGVTIRASATAMASHADAFDSIDASIDDIEAAFSLSTVSARFIEDVYGKPLRQPNDLGVWLTDTYRKLLFRLRQGFRLFGSKLTGIRQIVHGFTGSLPLRTNRLWRPLWILGQQLIGNGDMQARSRTTTNLLPNLNTRVPVFVSPAFGGAPTNFPGPFGQPPVPQVLTVSFSAGWNGGSVTIFGTGPSVDGSGDGITSNISIPDVHGNQTLTVLGVDFAVAGIGATITITGAANAANNGTFTVTATSLNQIQYKNPAGVVQAGFGGFFTVSGDQVSEIFTPVGAQPLASPETDLGIVVFASVTQATKGAGAAGTASIGLGSTKFATIVSIGSANIASGPPKSLEYLQSPDRIRWQGFTSPAVDISLASLPSGKGRIIARNADEPAIWFGLSYDTGAGYATANEHFLFLEADGKGIVLVDLDEATFGGGASPQLASTVAAAINGWFGADPRYGAALATGRITTVSGQHLAHQDQVVNGGDSGLIQLTFNDGVTGHPNFVIGFRRVGPAPGADITITYTTSMAPGDIAGTLTNALFSAFGRLRIGANTGNHIFASSLADGTPGNNITAPDGFGNQVLTVTTFVPALLTNLVGLLINIQDATNPANNNGTFTIVAATPSTVTYHNPGGVVEATFGGPGFPGAPFGAWSIQPPYLYLTNYYGGTQGNQTITQAGGGGFVLIGMSGGTTSVYNAIAVDVAGFPFVPVPIGDTIRFILPGLLGIVGPASSLRVHRLPAAADKLVLGEPRFSTQLTGGPYLQRSVAINVTAGTSRLPAVVEQVILHAAFADTVGSVTGGFTQPTHPTAVEVFFDAPWRGGTIRVSGTAIGGAPLFDLLQAPNQTVKSGVRAVSFDGQTILLGGRGATVSLNAPIATVQTLTDTTANFPVDIVGTQVAVEHATNPANNGVFTISARPSSTSISYVNAGGVVESPLGGVYGLSGGTGIETLAGFKEGMFFRRTSDGAGAYVRFIQFGTSLTVPIQIVLESALAGFPWGPVGWILTQNVIAKGVQCFQTVNQIDDLTPAGAGTGGNATLSIIDGVQHGYDVRVGRGVRQFSTGTGTISELNPFLGTGAFTDPSLVAEDSDLNGGYLLITGSTVQHFGSSPPIIQDDPATGSTATAVNNGLHPIFSFDGSGQNVIGIKHQLASQGAVFLPETLPVAATWRVYNTGEVVRVVGFNHATGAIVLYPPGLLIPRGGGVVSGLVEVNEELPFEVDGLTGPGTITLDIDRSAIPSAPQTDNVALVGTDVPDGWRAFNQNGPEMDIPGYFNTTRFDLLGSGIDTDGIGTTDMGMQHELDPVTVQTYRGFVLRAAFWVQQMMNSTTPQDFRVDFSFDGRNFTSGSAVPGSTSANPEPVAATLLQGLGSSGVLDPHLVEAQIEIPFNAEVCIVRLRHLGTATQLPLPFAAVERCIVTTIATGMFLGSHTVPLNEQKSKFGEVLYVWSPEPLNAAEIAALGLPTPPSSPADAPNKQGQIDNVVNAHGFWERFNVSEYTSGPPPNPLPLNVKGTYNEVEWAAAALTNMQIIVGSPPRLTVVAPSKVSQVQQEKLTVLAPSNAALAETSAHEGIIRGQGDKGQISISAPVVNIQTFTDPEATFPLGVVGQTITIVGSHSPLNEGRFIILSRPSLTSVTYTNAAGVVEPSFLGSYDIRTVFPEISFPDEILFENPTPLPATGIGIPVPKSPNPVGGSLPWRFLTPTSIQIASVAAGDPAAQAVFNPAATYTINYDRLIRAEPAAFDLGTNFPNPATDWTGYLWIVDAAIYLRRQPAGAPFTQTVQVQFLSNFQATLSDPSNQDQTMATLTQNNGTTTSVVPQANWRFLNGSTVEIDSPIFDPSSVYTLKYIALSPEYPAPATVVIEERSSNVSLVDVANQSYRVVQVDDPVRRTDQFHQLRVTITGVVDVRDVEIAGLGLRGIHLYQAPGGTPPFAPGILIP